MAARSTVRRFVPCVKEIKKSKREARQMITDGNRNHEDDPETVRLSLLDEPDANCESVAGLYSWSENCEHPTPFAVFLDLTGLSEEIFGDCISADMATAARNMGYMELAHLANALDDYSARPNETGAYARALVETEMQP